MKLDSFEAAIKWLKEALETAIKAIQEFYGWFNGKKDEIEDLGE